MLARCEAVTFDFWNTLAIAGPASVGRRIDASVALFAESGIMLPRYSVEAAVHASARAYEASWIAGKQFGAEQGADVCLAELGVEPPSALRSRLVAMLSSGDLDTKPAPNAAETLRALRAQGLRLGLISDIGFTPSSAVRSVLHRFGILELFDQLTFSDEVGHYKPSKAVFDHALDGLGISDPAAAIHVGDLSRTDVAGALAAGCVAVRYSGVFDDPETEPAAHHVIGDHAELPALVGGGPRA